MNRYHRPATARPTQPAPNPHSAAAWCALLGRASGNRVEVVEVPDGADAKATLRAWRGARMRATDQLYRQLQPTREA